MSGLLEIGWPGGRSRFPELAGGPSWHDSSTMRIVYLGTGDIGLPALRWLVGSRHEVVGIVTQPDRPVGRKQVMTPPQIKVVANAVPIPVRQPEKVGEDLDAARDWSPDVLVVMAYGQILPQAVLELPAVACINLHASLLPRHRGASPIQAAIRAGDAESGITVMHVAKGLDEGDVILSHPITLNADETGGSLHDRLAELAPGALAEALDLLEAGEARRFPQDGQLVTYAPKLGRTDGRIDWHLPAVELERVIRAYDPWPGSSTILPPGADGRGPGRQLKIFPPARLVEGTGRPGEVLTATGGRLVVAAGGGQALALFEVQPEGSRRMKTDAFLAGCPLTPGDRLGREEEKA